MNSLYLLINIGVLTGPFFLSFDKKVGFYKTWKSYLISTLIMATLYIPWDMAFTSNEIWGFNENYLTGFKLGNLPIEEVLFFITVPYACTFIYACTKAYFKINFNSKTILVLQLITGLLFIYICIIGRNQHYSFWASLCSLATLLTFMFLIPGSKFWSYFFISFLIACLPFILVNGILTGNGIDDEVVWYNPEHIFNKRIFTIPIEDNIYNFGMLLLSIGSYELINRKSSI